MPPVAKVAKAPVSSSGVTSAVPSARLGIGLQGETMPQRRAASITFRMPTSCARLTAMVLTLCARASARVSVPYDLPPKLVGV